MKSTLYILLSAILCSSAALAQNASEIAVAFESTPMTVTQEMNTHLVNTPWQDVATTLLKCPAGKSDLLVTFSGQSVLQGASFNADVRDSEGQGSGTREDVGIEIHLVVDGVAVPVAPPATATGVMLNTLFKDTFRATPAPVETIDILNLVIAKGGSNTFTWVVPHVGTGEHIVKVQARFDLVNLGTVTGENVSVNSYSTIFGALGPRTLTVQAVNLKQPTMQN